MEKGNKKDKVLKEIFDNDPQNILDIEGDDKSIAKFMGYTAKVVYRGTRGKETIYVNNSIREGHYKVLREFDYHKNWSSLIPVVDKIESIGSELTRYFDVVISYNGCQIHYTKQRLSELELKRKAIIEFYRNKKIDAVYITCLEFIKWYNEQA